MARPRTAGLPPCPLGYAGHTVRFGTYGPRRYARRRGQPRPFPPERATRVRQRYRCVRADGQGEHTFTERLPRHQPRPDPVQGVAVCLECERPASPRDGPPAPRRYSFTAREIARALIEVGRGVSYRSAGEGLRRDARVRRRNDRGAADWSLVADWVEVFGPTIAGELLPAAWEGGVLLDSVPFSVRRRRNVVSGQLVTGGGATYTILLGVCHTFQHGWRIYNIEAVGGRPNANTWVRFMSRLVGQPTHTCTDEEATLLAAIEQHWPHLPRRMRSTTSSTGSARPSSPSSRVSGGMASTTPCIRPGGSR